MKYIFSILFFIVITLSGNAQEKFNLSTKLKGLTSKGDYVILEVRLNKEDEFRTVEGGSSSLARISVFTGNNQGAELVSKGFEGMNSVLTILNELKQNGWKIVDVYPISGESLIITHYIIERRK
ncbi:MAG: hypothetical protein J5I47_12805 [Vicingus serpentipes]|nr:hypothetical protein [Vicingus serpentipes]